MIEEVILTDTIENILSKSWSGCKTDYWVYSLKDPNNNLVRYIGISKTPLKRFREHLKDNRTNKHKHNWLKTIDYKPIFGLLNLAGDEQEARLLEKKYISYYRNLENKLVNKTNGGDYIGEHIFSKEHLENIRIANKKNNKKVYQYDLEGNFIEEFESITKAANITKGNISKISEVVLGKRKSSGSYLWRNFKKEKIESYNGTDGFKSREYKKLLQGKL